MNIRAKFVVTKSSQFGYAADADGAPRTTTCHREGEETDVPLREVTLSAVPDKSFKAVTRAGGITMIVGDPDFKDEFALGSTYYVEFTPAK